MRKSALTASAVLFCSVALANGYAQAATLGTNSAIIVVGGAQTKTFNPAGPRSLNPQPLPPRWLGTLMR